VEGEGLGEGVENLPAQVMELKNKVLPHTHIHTHIDTYTSLLLPSVPD
jgi:hypothetical protein